MDTRALFQRVIELKEYFWSIGIRRWTFMIITIILTLFLLSNVTQCQTRSRYTMLSPLLNKTISTSFTTSQTNSVSITKMLVVSHFNEDLDWLDLFVGDRLPHIVYTRSRDSLARHSISINKGREAIAYLLYIVDHYSNLPSLIAFVHGHRTAWHQTNPSDLVVALRALRWNKYNYMPLTSRMTHAIFRLNTPDIQATVNFEMWRDVLEKELGAPPSNGIKTHCCATFVVRREAILAHPRIFYARIIEYLIASPRSDQLTGRTLEYTWHLIFGGNKPELAYAPCDLFVCDAKESISVELAEQLAGYTRQTEYPFPTTSTKKTTSSSTSSSTTTQTIRLGVSLLFLFYFF